MHAPFNVAFNTRMRYFEWLEKEENVFRLRRFGKAMTGTGGWEVPGSVIGGFPWLELSPRSVVVDVGGGIGSTSMLLANAFPQLRFVIQDRPPVVEMGVTAWRARHPEMLENGRAVFQAHDFFKPQPPYPAELDAEKTIPPPDSEGLNVKGKDVPAVFLLRVITHDWPDSYVTRILLRLRQTAGPSTRLLLADYVLPLACVDEDEDVEPEPTESDEDLGKKVTREPLPGTVRTLAPEGSPLLPNLGKANANAYWLDLTMRVMFNAQERTLRELAALTLSAGWKIVQVTRAPGSLFGHIIAVPVDIPPENLALPTMDEPEPDLESSAQGTFEYAEMDVRNPPMGHTFLTRVDLPSEDTIRQGVAVSKAVMASNQRGRKRKGRERAYTFTGHREGSGKDSKGGSEMKKGWRSIVRMLSKPHLGGDTHGNGNPKGDKPGEAR
ncbi:hypothetical protein EW026_g1615 [Hermanssonia centrifuga]|uniref:O-methyltransferase C-terminal domain-containing protein n=1 Tax=Hermanssonia centrifuga TaxID=98765 RepID=A0A4S4KQW8_9APHY|nr:hypothetical protein EW026_g1615 [Hermanssonia centrifuga]